MGRQLGQGTAPTALAPQGGQPALQQQRAADHTLRAECAAGGEAAGAGAGGHVGTGRLSHGEETPGVEQAQEQGWGAGHA